MIANQESLTAAAKHLSEHDAVLAPVIARAGLATFKPNKNYYQELVESIISQQLSVKAAASILKRFIDLFDGTFPTPEQILSKDVETLRGVGFSRGKATYVLDLAKHVHEGEIKFDHLDALTNEQVTAELVAVKGIGEWTAHMFLMFCMGRLDILATGDLGIRNGIQKLYGLNHSPSPQEITDIAAKHNWHPYESAACWYVWHSLDNKPVIT